MIISSYLDAIASDDFVRVAPSLKSQRGLYTKQFFFLDLGSLDHLVNRLALCLLSG